MASSLKIAVLGASGVGKSAVTVRYLTKRFIGEYTSEQDLLYTIHSPASQQENTSAINIDILDHTTNSERYEDNKLPEEQMRWANAYVLVYSVCDVTSFRYVVTLLRRIKEIRGATAPPTALILGNKADLEHCRVVSREEASQVALQEGCQFHEVSAADGYSHVSLAFNSLVREGCLAVNSKSPSAKRPRMRRTNSLKSVSKALANMFSMKNNSNKNNVHTETKLKMSPDVVPNS